MVEQDVKAACNVVDGTNVDPDYSSVYFCSNEPMASLFHSFSVKDKDVLSVMASGDQPLYSFYHGAKSVDTFDINILAKYYYYLRYWGILYRDQFYPPRTILKSHQYIYDLLQQVKCENEEEEEAYQFWSQFIQNAFPFDCNRFYFASHHDHQVKDMDLLKDRIRGKKVSFTHCSLFESMPIKKKYDVIITSNILEYGRQSNMILRKACTNLRDLLNDGGMVVASHVCDNLNSSYFVGEKDIFSQYFTYHEFPLHYDKTYRKSFPLGYAYRKRDVNKK